MPKLSLAQLLRRAAAWLARAGLSLVQRAYAAALIVAILYASYLAFRYLVSTIFVPATTPAQIADLPKRMDQTLLVGTAPDWSGLAAVDHPRTPPAHYHRFDPFIQRDAFNDCTRGGCHAPLPHAKHKETRAFLNMHATSIHCGVCHMHSDRAPLPLTWYRLDSGNNGHSPPLLAAAAWLEKQRDPAVRYEPADQATIVSLLREASRDAGGVPSLDRAAEHLRAVRAGSPAFVEFLAGAREAVERAFRGQYGAKLAMHEPDGRLLLGHPGTQRAVQNYLKEAPTATDARRDALLSAVHPLRRKQALECTACHRAEGSLVDFRSLGYPDGRIRALFDPAVFRMIENISKGQPFHLPRFAEPGGPRN